MTIGWWITLVFALIAVGLYVYVKLNDSTHAYGLILPFIGSGVFAVMTLISALITYLS